MSAGGSRAIAVFLTGVIGFGCVWGAPATASERFTFHHEHVLGTSLEIQVEAVSADSAAAAEARILKEIERLARIFSSYDATSELSRWQSRVGTPTTISPELFAVLTDCDRWHQRSAGAFNPAVEALTKLWKAAEKRNTLPTTAELADIVAQVQKPQWTLDTENQTATRLTDGSLSLNAIAKGAIIELASRTATDQQPDVHGVLVCIGGDMRVRGDLVQPIHIANPLNDAVNAAPIATIHVHNRALATSGNYRRGFQIQGQWYSHILDPRTGHPAAGIASATVVADTATDADALATIFNVLSPADSMALAETMPQVDYLLIDTAGRKYQSRGWSELEQPQLFRRAAVAADQLAQADSEKAPTAKPTAIGGLLELLVKFELAQPSGAQYRRPYVAVWLEDHDDFPVRTTVLWMQTKQPGPRWHRDLLRWYRNDAVRKLADGKALIGTISGATRGPGEYKAVFDGKDDAGNPLTPGKYTLFIEVAREHGTYQLIRHPLTLGDKPIAETKLKSNVEVKSATVEYRVPAPANPPAAP